MATSAAALRQLLPPGSERAAAGYLIDEIEPLLAQRPSTREQVAALLASAAEADLVVVPQGGRTALTMGRPLDRYDVALDLLGLDRIVAYEPDDLTVTVEAGVRLADLQTRLAAHGQYLPIDPPPDDRVTIGGLLATARPGAWRGQLPAARDLVLGMTLALPGQLVRSGGRVVKNVSGYDLHRLQTGALGAFGVIVEASFKLATLPPATRSFAIAADGVESAAERARELRELNLPFRALSIVAPSTASYFVGVSDHSHVLVECSGDEPTLDRCAAALGEGARELPERGWEQLRALAGSEEQIVVRLGVPATAVGDTVMQALDRGAWTWGHITAGSVLVAWPTSSFSGSMKAAIVGYVHALREHAVAQGGFLQIERGPAELRREVDPFGEGERELVRALRRQFDPKRTINRGRWEAEA